MIGGSFGAGAVPVALGVGNAIGSVAGQRTRAYAEKVTEMLINGGRRPAIEYSLDRE